MPKKSNSEGSVYYNKTRKRWTAQYYEKDINTGKRKRKAKSVTVFVFPIFTQGKSFLLKT